ncbi:uncharacterized protein LOC119109807 [Pollicipes pollicipes]|uniref:uncharacterized protein LOC119109807 n=1 Tax=Pollicipes pollicipes TaxID=41117 RepID=UPI0018849ACF|nr:uncharacterized protein LOC119109807 [Pollicipes pollicipes]
MKLLHLAVVACALGWAASQDAYTQGVVNGATLALAGTAVVGLGALAIKQHQSRRRNRYRYAPYYGGYYNGGYGGYNGYSPGYYQPQYYRRRRSTTGTGEVEQDFEKIMGQDKDQCGMRVVCELEAQAALGDDVDDFGKLIISLFGSNPAPVPTSALDTARGRYNYAAYIGSKSDPETCAELYSTCQFSSKSILQLVEASHQPRLLSVVPAPVADAQ